MKAWLPNALTLSRIVLLLPIIALLGRSTPEPKMWAFALFLIASFTDGLDGWIARRYGCESNVGIFLDPLADKIFANLLMLYLASHHPMWIPMWVTLLMLAREFAVQGFRSMAPCLGVVLRTGQMNKWKLVFQLIAIGACMVGLVWKQTSALMLIITWVALGLTLFTGIWSMLALFWSNRDLWQRRPLRMELR
ncbi:MAG: CDP-diacylglycerol--glycerol-3-phosphate 3-phosphatidyltransferase [Candidatus Thiodiazotropha sp. (ex Ctena orbiculata)]|nr:CDP-diacylglycerol--glycerol-3-phosphate 3-phosphatidyltransferase [Candidatus Thiodiazotropha taylori]MBT2995706.1 CDP-diacylglycerol--glycerol-3-phosphate 3-phosphatidyltransferase [Candidatus Thiodiazotropha taylori]MBT2999339.1 CDP-diacylglycerol--glycerol-3-phosphate 3-phosphatidyltransferase [Candidatus Thiodiazotropha taylori]MBV2108501.1 CDP-diacylglycerol--glycerol-3-phosphate 3-phosphatidyltransferase [Candidatus Thiodiazotropha taylori]MBV2112996.1 CDP-diacylglycerol--glycerol-3-p